MVMAMVMVMVVVVVVIEILMAMVMVMVTCLCLLLCVHYQVRISALCGIGGGVMCFSFRLLTPYATASLG